MTHPLTPASAAKTVTVSAVISAYSDERWELLRRAVGSLERQTVPPLETIVVIDHNPRLLERARGAFGGARVVENAGDRGAAGARNTGVEHARGDVVAFLDDDAAADPRWVEEITRAHAERAILGVAGRLEPRWESGRPRWFPEEFQWVVGCDYRGLPSDAAPVRNVIAANMSVDRALFAAAGGFRKGFGKVGDRSEPEETELCIRLSAMNPSRPWMYWPDARADHHVPDARVEFGYFLRRCRLEGMGKASLRGVVRGRESLASEWAYVLRVRPAGVLRGVYEGVRRRDPGGFARAAVVVLGLAVTVLGFCEQALRLRLARGARGAGSPSV